MGSAAASAAHKTPRNHGEALKRHENEQIHIATLRSAQAAQSVRLLQFLSLPSFAIWRKAVAPAPAE
jgi:hypothetical protein